MTIREFLAKHSFEPYSSPVNSWDSFRADGTALMQLWDRHSNVVRDAANPGHYMRVKCWDSEHHAAEGKKSAVGYAGRRRALDQIESGRRAFVVMSAPPSSVTLGPGVWAQNANLERAYPVVDVEHADNGDIFVIVGRPVQMTAI
jgi:hypothetical protein